MDGQTFKLGDFGLCISLDQGFTNALEGDAKYMASELMRGEFGMAADIFRSVCVCVSNCYCVCVSDCVCMCTVCVSHTVYSA